MQWAEEHIRKDVCRLNSKLASTTNTQLKSSWSSQITKRGAVKPLQTMSKCPPPPLLDAKGKLTISGLCTQNKIHANYFFPVLKVPTKQNVFPTAHSLYKNLSEKVTLRTLIKFYFYIRKKILRKCQSPIA